MIVWMVITNAPWSGKFMILLVDLDLQKIHLRGFMYTTWKKLISTIIIIRFGIDPGIYNTSIAATSNNLMIVWMVNTRSLIQEQGGVWVCEQFTFFFFLFQLDKLESLKTYYILSLFFIKKMCITQNLLFFQLWELMRTKIIDYNMFFKPTVWKAILCRKYTILYILVQIIVHLNTSFFKNCLNFGIAPENNSASDFSEFDIVLKYER